MSYLTKILILGLWLL